MSTVTHSSVRRTVQRSAAVLAALFAAFTVVVVPAPAADADGGGIDLGFAGDLTLSVQASVPAPPAGSSSSQGTYQAQVSLTYVLSDTVDWPIRQIVVSDSLVSHWPATCAGWPVVWVLEPHSSVSCTVEVSLPPGSYASSARAIGWVECLLVLNCPVSADADTHFTVAAPPPPSPTPPPPTPSPKPRPHPTYRPVYVPPQQAAQVQQLPTHSAVLLLMLPAAAAAAVAGAAMSARRR